jgi:hypothetical protein
MYKRQQPDGGGSPVPNPPGSLYCPSINDQIKNNNTDNDPYDDRELFLPIRQHASAD